MSYERAYQWAKRWKQFTPQGFVYDLDGLSPDGGHYLLFVPPEATQEEITAARVFLRNQNDVVSCTTVRVEAEVAA